MNLKSNIDVNSEAFAKNAAHHRGLATELRERTAQIALGGPEEARAQSGCGFERSQPARVPGRRS